jgi:hypothetical protein
LWAAHSQRCALAYRIVDSCAELASVSHLHLVRGGRKISFRMGGLDTGSGRWLGCMGTGHWQQTAMQAKLGCNLTRASELHGYNVAYTLFRARVSATGSS